MKKLLLTLAILLVVILTTACNDDKPVGQRTPCSGMVTGTLEWETCWSDYGGIPDWYQGPEAYGQSPHPTPANYRKEPK